MKNILLYTTSLMIAMGLLLVSCSKDENAPKPVKSEKVFIHKNARLTFTKNSMKIETKKKSARSESIDYTLAFSITYTSGAITSISVGPTGFTFTPAVAITPSQQIVGGVSVDGGSGCPCEGALNSLVNKSLAFENKYPEAPSPNDDEYEEYQAEAEEILDATLEVAYCLRDNQTCVGDIISEDDYQDFIDLIELLEQFQ